MREDNEKLRDMLEAIARINKYMGLGRATSLREIMLFLSQSNY